MSYYPQTVNIAWTVQGGGGGGGITLAEFQAYQTELDALVAAATEVNDDISDSTTTTWSSAKIEALLAAI